MKIYDIIEYGYWLLSFAFIILSEIINYPLWLRRAFLIQMIGVILIKLVFNIIKHSRQVEVRKNTADGSVPSDES